MERTRADPEKRNRTSSRPRAACTEMRWSHAGPVGRAEGRQQAALVVPADPHVPPPVASEGPAATVRRGAERRAPVGGARGGNDAPMVAGATGSWEDAPALAARGSAHDDTQPLAGGGGLCSDELLALATTGQQQRGLRQRHGNLRRQATDALGFYKENGCSLAARH